jgi:hypothetical protein
LLTKKKQAPDIRSRRWSRRGWLTLKIHLCSGDEVPKSSAGLPATLSKRSQVTVVAVVASADLELSLQTSEKYYLTVKSLASEKVGELTFRVSMGV